MNNRKMFLALVLISIMSSQVAHAHGEAQGYLNAALRFYEMMDYDRAFEYFERARLMPHTAEEVILIELYEGVMLANLSEEEEAAKKFKTALERDSDSQLPVMVSPLIRAEFESIRKEVERKGRGRS